MRVTKVANVEIEMIGDVAVEVLEQTGLHFFVGLITPAAAAALLAGPRAPNRSVRRVTADRYTRMLLADKWHLTHQGLAFDTQDRLLDGQHRLSAVVASGVSMQTLVVTGVEQEAFHAMDVGARRTVAEALMASKDLVAVTQAVFGFGPSGAKAHLSADEIASCIAGYHDSLQFAIDALYVGGKLRHLTTSLIASIIARAHMAGEDPARLIQFGKVFTSGLVVDPKADVAAIRARNLVLEIGGTGVRQTGSGMLAKIERAVSAFCDRDPISRLYAAEELIYPRPVCPLWVEFPDSAPSRPA